MVKSSRLGPGTLVLGGTETPMDASCQLENGVVEWDKDKSDDKRTLCGDTVAGATKYTSGLSGTFLQDLSEEEGLVAWTWAHKGEEQPFVFIPNTADGATVTGVVIVDPLSVGSDDEYGEVMESDFEWDCVGEPTLTWGAAA